MSNDTITPDAIEREVSSFIMSEVMFEDPNATLTNQTQLLEGIMDSVSLMQLVAFIEEEFPVEIEDVEINKANFSTIDSIAGLITSKIA
ncbi:MAG: acyl carrier protein [Actinomycetota bacterium]